MIPIRINSEPPSTGPLLNAASAAATFTTRILQPERNRCQGRQRLGRPQGLLARQGMPFGESFIFYDLGGVLAENGRYRGDFSFFGLGAESRGFL